MPLFYTGCPGENVPDFRRMFHTLKYTNLTQNTYTQSWTVTEIMAREMCGLLPVPHIVHVQLIHYPYTVHVRPWEWNAVNVAAALWMVSCTEFQKCLLCFPTWNIVTTILCMDFAMAMHMLLLKNTKGIFPIEGFRLEVYLLVSTRQCVRLVVFQVLLCSLKRRRYEQENILEMAQRSPHLSTHRMASRIGVSRMQVWRTLHEDNLYPYHDQRVQHLEPGGHDQRMDLCHWIKAHPKLVSNILFTDEVSFTRDGVNNSWNVHTWSLDNPHETSVTNFQQRFSLNVWCGVLGNRLIGPFVFDNNLTGNTYEAFLRNELPGLLEDIPLMIRSQMYFQHDGAPHITLYMWGSTYMNPSLTSG